MKKLPARKFYGISLVMILVLGGCPAPGGVNGGGGGGGGDILINPANPVMLSGGMCQLRATRNNSDITQQSDLIWTSSNPAVATVSGGNVKAIGAGKATISAALGAAKGSAAVTVQGVTNRIILYVSTSADTSQYFSGYNITVDSEYQTVIRLVPDANLADVVTQNSSYSFASSAVYPYTVDNRLFVRRDVRPNEYSGSHSFIEYNPKTNEQILSFDVANPNSGADNYYAVLGSTYYYRVNRTYDFMYGDLGGEFNCMMISNNASGAGTLLLSSADPDNCKGNLQASNGALYDANYYDVSGSKYLDIYKRNPSSGRTYAAKSWTVNDAAQYWTNVEFAFDGGIAYWARMRLSDKQVEIWKNDFVATDPSLVYSGVVPGMEYITFFDASNGHLAVGCQLGTILLYDVSGKTSTTVNLGFTFYGLQILYLFS